MTQPTGRKTASGSGRRMVPDGMESGATAWAHVRVLRGCGYMRTAGGWHRLYCGAVLALVTLYLAQEALAAWLCRSDLEELSRVLFLLLCHVTALAKQLVLQTRGLRLERLLARFDGPRWCGGDARQRGLVLATHDRSARFARAFAGTAVVTCSLWALFAGVRRARGQRVQLPLWLPFDYQPPLVFCLVLCYSYYVTTLVGIANTTMDALVASILSHCCTQLRILRQNFESVVERAAGVAKQNGLQRIRGGSLMPLLVADIEHYVQITETVKMLEDVFGGAILIQFAIGGWILCMAVYKMVSLSALSVEFASMSLFTGCILTELFIYCYYGNELTFESERVCVALFSCGWSGQSREFRSALLLSLTRARRPLRAAAGGVVPLQLDTFIKIIKSSYTFYAVLKQTGTE